MRNVLLVVFDTARADSFEPYEASVGATPTAAQLAARGTALPYVVAPSNWTLPSHASMFTGLLPGTLGLTSGVKTGSKAGLNSRGLLEARADRVLASVLRARGYRTAGISANPWIHEVNGFGIGFDVFHSIHGVHRKPPGGDLRSKIEWAVDAWRARADDGAENAARLLQSLMDETDAGKPFFWFVNLMECHSPYLPPRPFNDLSAVERVKGARDAARYQTPQGAYRVSVGDLRMSPETVERTRHLYARAIAQMDAWLGRMLDELERRRMLDDTLVVLASDHGENLGEEGLIGHVISMSDRLLKVPLIASSPVSVGHDGPISLAELPRLIAGAIDLGEHPWTDDVRPGGAAVSQVAGQILLPDKEALALGWGIPEEAIRRIASPMTSATDGRFKLIRDVMGERLYDLEADPTERSQLDDRVEAAKLRSAIDHVESLTAEGSAFPSERIDDDETRELEDRLRDLGYI